MSPSNSSSKEGMMFYDDIMSSEFIDSYCGGSVHSSDSSRVTNSLSRAGTDMLSTNSVDSLLQKGVKRDKIKYKIPDFTMGALSLQESVPLIIPDLPEEDLQEDSTSTKRFTSNKEADPRAKFAVTSVNSEKYTSAAMERARSRQSRRGKRLHASRAAAVLNDARSDLLSEKSSVVLDMEIPFSESMDMHVEKWRSERNFVHTRPVRPKSSGLRDHTPNVDFSQLLMDESEMGGLSAEQSQTLVSQYSREFSSELDFLG